MLASEVDTTSRQREMGQGPSLFHVIRVLASGLCLLSPRLTATATACPPALNRFHSVILFNALLLLMSFLKKFLKAAWMCFKEAEDKRKLEPVATSLSLAYRYTS